MESCFLVSPAYKRESQGSERHSDLPEATQQWWNQHLYPCLSEGKVEVCISSAGQGVKMFTANLGPVSLTAQCLQICF
jgi:hypothetical protein